MSDLAVFDGDHGNETVVVGTPGTDRSAMDGVLEGDDRGFAVAMHSQIVRAVATTSWSSATIRADTDANANPDLPAR